MNALEIYLSQVPTQITWSVC